MRILFVGALWQGSTGRQRMVSLYDLGHEIIELNATPRRKPSIVERVMHRLGYQLDTVGVNTQILSSTRDTLIDLIWVDKTLSISSRTLLSIKQRLPTCRLLFYSPDDMMHPRNQTWQYRACLPIYDLHVTTKSYNVSELEKLGAKKVLFVEKAYDPHTHRPMILTPEDRENWQADVGFVGGFEQQRYEMMLQLAQAGVSISVHGPGWELCVGQHPNFAIKAGWLVGDDYTRAICATKVNLGFLRKAARDLQTARSIEIPACGAFMLAERTDEHLQLFIEGKEAEFFANIAELINKAKYYLAHDVERERIAQAGRERCVKSGYSNHERLAEILKYLDTLPRIND